MAVGFNGVRTYLKTVERLERDQTLMQVTRTLDEHGDSHVLKSPFAAHDDYMAGVAEAADAAIRRLEPAGDNATVQKAIGHMRDARSIARSEGDVASIVEAQWKRFSSAPDNVEDALAQAAGRSFSEARVALGRGRQLGGDEYVRWVQPLPATSAGTAPVA